MVPEPGAPRRARRYKTQIPQPTGEPVLVDIAADDIRGRLGIRIAVAHGHTGMHVPQHIGIVFAVAEGHGLFGRDAVVVEQGLDACDLTACRRHDIVGATVPARRLAAGQASHEVVLARGVLVDDGLEDRQVGSRLVDRRHGSRHLRLHLADMIVDEVRVHAHRLVEQDGATAGAELLQQHREIVPDDGIRENHLAVDVARLLAADQHVSVKGKVLQGQKAELRHGASRGDDHLAAAATQLGQGGDRTGRNPLGSMRDKCAIHVEEDGTGRGRNHRLNGFRHESPSRSCSNSIRR